MGIFLRLSNKKKGMLSLMAHLTTDANRKIVGSLMLSALGSSILVFNSAKNGFSFEVLDSEGSTIEKTEGLLLKQLAAQKNTKATV
jgi:hypothetical protein